MFVTSGLVSAPQWPQCRPGEWPGSQHRLGSPPPLYITWSIPSLAWPERHQPPLSVPTSHTFTLRLNPPKTCCHSLSLNCLSPVSLSQSLETFRFSEMKQEKYELRLRPVEHEECGFLSLLSPVLRNMRGHKPGFVRAQSLVSLSHYCWMFFGSLWLICHRGAECLEIDHGDHDQGQEPGAAHPDRVVQISAHEI